MGWADGPRPLEPQPAGALGRYFFHCGEVRAESPCHWVLGGVKCIHVAQPSPPSVSVCLSSSFRLATEACSVRHCLPPLPSPQPFLAICGLDPDEQDRTGSVLRLMHFSEQNILSVYPAESGVTVARLL